MGSPGQHCTPNTRVVTMFGSEPGTQPGLGVATGPEGEPGGCNCDDIRIAGDPSYHVLQEFNRTLHQILPRSIEMNNVDQITVNTGEQPTSDEIASFRA